MNELLLPEETRLLHIGPHKTGTTAIQGALLLARPDLPAQGVVYPGKRRQHALAARAATGSPGPRGDSPASMGDWEDLVRDVAAAGGKRVVVSSESFATADTETARSIVDQLGGPKVHILVTLRPLSKIMPSAWQQYVREGMRTSYDRWLEGMLTTPPYNKPTPSFWQRHRHDVLVERWASIVGPENVTVVVLDGSDHAMLTRTVEQLVGLPRGFLQPEPGRTNRSLTYGEIELVRELNHEFKRREWSDEMFRIYIRYGMIAHLQATYQPKPSEGQIPTPSWALARAGEIGAGAAEKISALGVRIVGDISALGDGAASPPRMELAAPAPVLSIAVAAEAVVGTMAVYVSKAQSAEGGSKPAKSVTPLSSTSTRELAGVILKRVSHRMTSRSTVRPLNRQPGADQSSDEVPAPP